MKTSHEHRQETARIVGLDWGTRTVETCSCGAYRTCDVPRGDSPRADSDFAWSEWRRTSFDLEG